MRRRHVPLPSPVKDVVRRWPWAAALVCGLLLLALDVRFPDVVSVRIGPRERSDDDLMRLSAMNLTGVLMAGWGIASGLASRLEGLAVPRSRLWPVSIVACLVGLHHAALFAMRTWWPDPPQVSVHAADIPLSRNTFFFGRDAEYFDTIETRGWFGADGNGDPFDSGTFYPPLAVAIARLLLRVETPTTLLAMLLFITVAVMLGVCCVWRGDRRAALLLAPIAFASYPVLFEMERANFDAFALPFFVFALLAFRRMPWAAVAAGAVGVAVKVFTWPVAWGTLSGRPLLRGLIQITVIAWISLLSCLALSVPADSVLAPLKAVGSLQNGDFGLDITSPYSGVQYSSSLDAGVMYVTFHLANPPGAGASVPPGLGVADGQGGATRRGLRADAEGEGA